VKTLLLSAAILLAAAPAASAQLPTDPGQPTTPTTPTPTTPTPPTTPAPPAPAAGGNGVMRLAAPGIVDGGRLYVAGGNLVTINGRIKPFVAGQQMIVELYRGKRRVARKVVAITRAKDKNGEFVAQFRIRTQGTYTVKARHRKTAEQKAFALANRKAEVMTGDVNAGSSREKIHLVQLGLKRLAFVTSTSGRWDDATSRAVIAFRKTNSMSRTGGSTSRRGFAMLLNGEGGFKLKYPDHGKHVEADLSRQVLVLADHGRPLRIYHTSSGAPATPTVTGSYRFYRKQLGTNAKGMVDSSYFIRGYAIHGYHSVPTYNASHGCLRVPVPNARSIYDWIKLGDRIDVYP
jgi:hypothetical protein